MQEHLRWWTLFAFIAIICVSADAPPRFARSLAAYKTDKVETEPVSEVDPAHPGDLYSENHSVVRDVRKSKSNNTNKKNDRNRGNVNNNNTITGNGSGTNTTNGTSQNTTNLAVLTVDPSSSGGSPDSSQTGVPTPKTSKVPKASSTESSTPTTLKLQNNIGTNEAPTTLSVVSSGQESEPSSSSKVAETSTAKPAVNNPLITTKASDETTETSDKPTDPSKKSTEPSKITTEASDKTTEAFNETIVIPDAITNATFIHNVSSTESTPNVNPNANASSTSKKPDTNAATVVVLSTATQPSTQNLPPVLIESSSVTPIDTTKTNEPTVTHGQNREENPEEGISAALLSPTGCQKLSADYKSCDEACKAAENFENSGNEFSTLLIIALGFLAFALIVLILLSVFAFRLRSPKKPPASETETKQPEEKLEDPRAQRRAAEDAAVAKKDVEKKEEKSDEAAVQEDTPSLKNNPALERMRDKLKRTQDNLRLLRTHANKCAEEHKKDLANKFTPMGPIYIPMEPEVPPPVDIPSCKISLTNVAWKDGLNELWEVGSDVDDIELDEDFVLNPDSVTEDEASQKSGKSKKSAKSKSKKSKKSHKSHKDDKDGDMKTPKLDAASVPSTSGTGPSTSGTGPSTSGLPSVSAPGPTAPAAEKPNASETKKEQNKSKEN